MILKGFKKFSDRLKAMTAPAQSKRIAARLYEIGQKIELDAERSITRGSISGKNHVPSAPGQPPNADTRHLDGNIVTILKLSRNPSVTVESRAAYSVPLEYGTDKMEERPFMRPAVEKNRRRVANLDGIRMIVK